MQTFSNPYWTYVDLRAKNVVEDDSNMFKLLYFMSVALPSTAVVLRIPLLLSDFTFHACYVRALVDTLQYVFKLLIVIRMMLALISYTRVFVIACLLLLLCCTMFNKCLKTFCCSWTLAHVLGQITALNRASRSRAKTGICWKCCAAQGLHSVAQGATVCLAA